MIEDIARTEPPTLNASLKSAKGRTVNSLARRSASVSERRAESNRPASVSSKGGRRSTSSRMVEVEAFGSDLRVRRFGTVAVAPLGAGISRAIFSRAGLVTDRVWGLVVLTFEALSMTSSLSTTLPLAFPPNTALTFLEIPCSSPVSGLIFSFSLSLDGWGVLTVLGRIFFVVIAFLETLVTLEVEEMPVEEVVLIIFEVERVSRVVVVVVLSANTVKAILCSRKRVWYKLNCSIASVCQFGGSMEWQRTWL
jgi:hypothetical protein